MKADTEKALTSIVKQWNGGEHKLAGARASELVYGASKSPDQKLLDQLMEKAPGIERYISAPVSGEVVDRVSDQGGDPLTNQPENRDEATGESNLSTDKGKDEQDAIDKKLEPGRKARAKKADKSDDKGNVGGLVSTKLNPDPQNPGAA